MGTADLLSDVILHQPMKTATAQHLEEAGQKMLTQVRDLGPLEEKKVLQTSVPL